MARQAGFVDVHELRRRLIDWGDQLKAYSAVMDFEIFWADLGNALGHSYGKKSGRPPFDLVMMTKVQLEQDQSNLQRRACRVPYLRRALLHAFPEPRLQEKVPNAKTTWSFRERLTVIIDALFGEFDTALRYAGYIAGSGQLVDSTLVAAPKQRNTDEEKRYIKPGMTVAEIWPDDPAKARQKDVDARRTVQFGQAKTPRDGGPISPDIAVPGFGHKDHAGIDKTLRFIQRWHLTDAAKHDTQMLRQGLLDASKTGSGVSADSA